MLFRSDFSCIFFFHTPCLDVATGLLKSLIEHEGHIAVLVFRPDL